MGPVREPDEFSRYLWYLGSDHPCCHQEVFLWRFGDILAPTISEALGPFSSYISPVLYEGVQALLRC